MAFTACAVLLGLTMSGVPLASIPAPATTPAVHASQSRPLRDALLPTPPLARWQRDQPQARPAVLPVMYATLGALQVADVYSTRRALGAGAYEANPVIRRTVKNAGAMLAAKALSSVATIYFTERAWKKNRKGAVILMAAINGVTAAITARNLRNVRR